MWRGATPSAPVLLLAAISGTPNPVEIVLEKVRVAEVVAIKKRLKAAPEVQQVYNVTGDVDLMLVVLARDVKHFEEISRSLFSADPHVRRYRTSLVMDRVKTGQTITLETEIPIVKRQPGRR